MILDSDHSSRSGAFDDATPAEEEALRAYGHSSKGWVFNKSMRYSEKILEVGDAIYALGEAQVPGEMARIGKGKGPFLVSDRREEALTSHYQRQRTMAGIGAILVPLLLAIFWDRIPFN